MLYLRRLRYCIAAALDLGSVPILLMLFLEGCLHLRVLHQLNTQRKLTNKLLKYSST